MFGVWVKEVDFVAGEADLESVSGLDWVFGGDADLDLGVIYFVWVGG